jgi:hypothetical protein
MTSKKYMTPQCSCCDCACCAVTVLVVLAGPQVQCLCPAPSWNILYRVPLPQESDVHKGQIDQWMRCLDINMMIRFLCTLRFHVRFSFEKCSFHLMHEVLYGSFIFSHACFICACVAPRILYSYCMIAVVQTIVEIAKCERLQEALFPSKSYEPPLLQLPEFAGLGSELNEYVRHSLIYSATLFLLHSATANNCLLYAR